MDSLFRNKLPPPDGKASSSVRNLLKFHRIFELSLEYNSIVITFSQVQ
jgi:hypothetical protein